MCQSRHIALVALAAWAGQTALAAGDKNESTVTLYGSLSQGVKITDRGKKNDGKVDYLNDHLRIGIKATEALGGNTQAFFNLHLTSKETKDGSGLNGLREAYIGLKGDFGKLTLGRQNTAWKSYMGKSVFDDAAIGLARPGKVIRYDLDNIGGSGFKFAIDGILDGSHEVIKNGKNRAFNAYDATIGYNKNGIDASLGYQTTSVPAIETELGGKTKEIMGASVAFTFLENKDKKQSRWITSTTPGLANLPQPRLITAWAHKNSAPVGKCSTMKKKNSGSNITSATATISASIPIPKSKAPTELRAASTAI